MAFRKVALSASKGRYFNSLEAVHQAGNGQPLEAYAPCYFLSAKGDLVGL
jgi:hypothetical protein